MNWEQARELLFFQRRRTPSGLLAPAPHRDVDELAAVRASSLCIASGKGGTGKSVVTASLGALLARKGRTLIVDADMGVGNAHILQNVSPEHSFVDVVEGRLGVREVLTHARAELDLVAAGSGVSRMAGLSNFELHLIACGIESLESGYRHVLVDSAAGISTQTVSFAAASDVVLIVTTPDVTALTDAYAFLKVFTQRRADCVPLFVVNRATSEEEALSVAERFRGVSHKFLGREPRSIGWIPDDREVVHSVSERQPVVLAHPGSPAAQALERIAAALVQEFTAAQARGLGRQLLRTVGYTPKIA
ncbi:MAG: AAA family ATPase [Planctomycetes bacterium]|nr:AAA family ATPase [Planctomycetota bacterium]